MAWQSEVGSGTNRATDYHDLLTKKVAFLTSQHVATVAPNAGGTGYVVGDEVTLTHAGAYLDARFEVTSVSGGAITGLRIVSSGAFADRLATVAVNAGGTGYAVNDVVEIQGGSSREKGKALVTAVSGGVVTGVSVFETGGAYSTPPAATGAATLGVGPSGFAGDDALTLDTTTTGLIGTTGLAVTGGSGSGGTVDITLAETGWAVDGRNTNDRSHNGVTNEKEVVLVGDAAGWTNKPYIGFGTLTFTSGVDTFYHIALYGLITHNPAIALASQVSMRGDPGTFSDNNPYLTCNDNQAKEMDFWIAADDLAAVGVVNVNADVANTDDAVYMHWHHGFLDPLATETENPYPAFVFAPNRTRTVGSGASSIQITGLSEMVAPNGQVTGAYYWRVEDATWVSVRNSDNLSTNDNEANVMAPVAKLTPLNAAVPDYIVKYGSIHIYTGIGSTGRTSPTRRLRMIPGTTPQHFPIPLSILSRPGGTTLDETLDMPRGQVRNGFWVYNTDSAGATIANFSEDYITIGSDRYRVFHTHTQRQLYHFICIREAV